MKYIFALLLCSASLHANENALFFEIYDLYQEANIDIRQQKQDSELYWIAVGRMHAYDHVLYLLCQ